MVQAAKDPSGCGGIGGLYSWLQAQKLTSGTVSEPTLCVAWAMAVATVTLSSSGTLSRLYPSSASPRTTRVTSSASASGTHWSSLARALSRSSKDALGHLHGC